MIYTTLHNRLLNGYISPQGRVKGSPKILASGGYMYLRLQGTGESVRWLMNYGNMSLKVLLTVEAFATLLTEDLCLAIMDDTMLLQGKAVCE